MERRSAEKGGSGSGVARRTAGRGLMVVGLLVASVIPGRTAGAQERDALAARDAAALQAILDDMEERWNADDLEGHVAAYTDDATYTTARGVLRGRRAIVENLAGFRTPDGLYGELRFEDVDMRPLGPDHALVTGRFVLSAPGKADSAGRFTLVMARTPDGWRAIHDHSS